MSNEDLCFGMQVIIIILLQGGWIIYFGESFSLSYDMVNDFWKIVSHFHGVKKL